MYLPTTNTIAWATNSSEKLRLDASGNLGLGVTPSAWISSGRAFDLGAFNSLSQTSSGSLASTFNAYQNSSGNWIYKTTNPASQYQTGLAGTAAHAWFTAPSGTAGNAISFTQAMTLNASGNLLLGNTAAIDTNTERFQVYYTYPETGATWYNTSTNTTYAICFRNPNGLMGNITTTSTTTQYNAASDQRLKENIVNAPSAIDSVNAIKVRSFDWKSDGSHVDYGYIAQELLEVAPEAVSVPANEKEMMGVDFGKLTPRLVKAIQELTQRLEALEAK
jgi:hypothetical protein